MVFRKVHDLYFHRNMNPEVERIEKSLIHTKNESQPFPAQAAAKVVFYLPKRPQEVIPISRFKEKCRGFVLDSGFGDLPIHNTTGFMFA